MRSIAAAALLLLPATLRAAAPATRPPPAPATAAPEKAAAPAREKAHRVERLSDHAYAIDRDFLAAVQARAKVSPGKTSGGLAESFDAAAWPEWKPMPTFVTWETLFDAATGRGPGRVIR